MNHYIAGAIITILGLLTIAEVAVISIMIWFVVFTVPVELEGLEK
ncbi:hypothetical protein LCGC14_2739780 [marine sediment metagenome]|uniref:Uncharacterized protein n=1 Tax=marine sediment metagenome TaxID=412755 RepID=A0A0F8ZS47_9ZZZZ